jgi:hypothetical protein
MTVIVMKPEPDDAYVVNCCECGKPMEPEYEDCLCLDEYQEVYMCDECYNDVCDNGHVDIETLRGDYGLPRLN